MVKNYIYYAGGMFGDLLFAIVNNGVHLPDWIQNKLKNLDPLDQDFRKFMCSLNLHTLTGCHSDPLSWNLENYVVVCSDNKICAWTVTRFFGMYPKLSKRALLKCYYDNSIHDEIDRLTDQQLQQILVKKYQSIQHSTMVSDRNTLDVSCIFDRDALISVLDKHFEFDGNLARQQYAYWWQREQGFLQQFGEAV